MFYDTSQPEAHARIDETVQKPGPTYHTSEPWSKRLVVIVAFVIASAVVIGVVVGTWRRHQHSPHKASSNLNETHPILNHTSSAALGPILNDTSLAALVLASGDRSLFFQDNTGIIRQAVRPSPNGPWITSAGFNVTGFNVISSARNHTPLAAVIAPDDSASVLERKPLNVCSLQILTGT